VLASPRGAARWAAADLVKLVKPGPDRVASGCPSFDEGCGGCQWRHLSYEAQLAWKHKNLAAALKPRLGSLPVQPVLGMENPEAYRNKLSLKYEGGRLVFLPETEGATLAPRDCPVQTPALQAAWTALRRFKAAGVDQVHLRSNAAGQVGVHVFADERAADTALRELCDAVRGAGLGVTTKRGYRVVTGEPVLKQTIGATTWLIPHNGFYQTNESMAAVLLTTVEREARLQPAQRLLDLYCGSGFFGLALARGAREVVGIEENPQSVQWAAEGARLSGIANARFVAGDLGAELARVAVEDGETAIVDPPREGLLPRALQVLIDRQPRRIIYVSCAPSSLVRDLKPLQTAGWRAVSCQPVDLFPHTSHLEVVVALERVSGSKPN
jgi:23S rRNA (uracil1939-C5)-methyltransferase